MALKAYYHKGWQIIQICNKDLTIHCWNYKDKIEQNSHLVHGLVSKWYEKHFNSNFVGLCSSLPSYSITQSEMHCSKNLASKIFLWSLRHRIVIRIKLQQCFQSEREFKVTEINLVYIISETEVTERKIYQRKQLQQSSQVKSVSLSRRSLKPVNMTWVTSGVICVLYWPK